MVNMTDTSKDNEKEHLTIKILEDFSSRTTLHGVNSIAHSKTRAGKIAWSVLLILAFGYTINSTICSFIRYTKHPFSTEVTEQFAGDSGLKFPVITLCSMNMFVKRKIQFQDNNPLFEKYGLNLDICKQTKAMRQPHNITCGQLLMCTADAPEFHPGYGCRTANELMKALLAKPGNNVSSNFEEQFRKMYGPKLEHSIQFCKFGQERCNAKDFTEYITSFGNCFQYNGDVDNVTCSFGKESMTMILDAKVDDYTKSSRFTEGFKFYIHDQGTFNSPEGGFVVSPGNIATVTVQQKKMIYLESPFKSNCTKRKLQSYRTYTIAGCLNECFQDMVVQRCGCRSFGYTLRNRSQDIRVCSGYDSKCKRRLMRGHFNPKGCVCPPPCQQTTYTYQISYSSFPDSGTKDVIKKYGKVDFEYQRKNLVAITIFYQATSYELHEQQESYSFEAFLGELGGNLGLMVGCSVLTGAEICQLIIQLVFNTLRNWFPRDKRKVAWMEGS